MSSLLSMQQLRSRIGQKDVQIRDSAPVAILRSTGAGRVCLICATNKSSYCCPRCYVPYCSAVCYGKHDMDCTEGFSRQRVKEVLDLEAVYQTCQSPSSNSADRGTNEFGAYSGAQDLGQLQSMLALTSDNSGGADEDEGDYITNDSSGGGDQSGVDEVSADGVDIGDVKAQVSTHALSRYVELWNPWWWRDLSGSGSLSIVTTAVRTFEMREGVSQAVNCIKRTAPRLGTLVNASKLSSELLGYQIFGLVLGYVVTMRTLNGDWYDTPIEAMIQLVQSTPAATDQTFKPLSVAQAVEAWLRYRPVSLQQTSRRAVRALLEDALAVLRVWEFVSFALLECWLMALLACRSQQCRCAVHTDSGGDSVEAVVENKYTRLLEHMRTQEWSGVVDEILPAMDEYSEVFRRPKKTKAKSGEDGRDQTNSSSNSDCWVQNSNHVQESAEQLARKAFFVFLFTLDEGSFEPLRLLSSELHEYLAVFMA